jgi:hypothetical protein
LTTKWQSIRGKETDLEKNEKEDEKVGKEG